MSNGISQEREERKKNTLNSASFASDRDELYLRVKKSKEKKTSHLDIRPNIALKDVEENQNQNILQNNKRISSDLEHNTEEEVETKPSTTPNVETEKRVHFALPDENKQEDSNFTTLKNEGDTKLRCSLVDKIIYLFIGLIVGSAVVFARMKALQRKS